MPIRFQKEVSALPGTLVADTVYFVRVGSGFDLYVSDQTGTTAHKVNDQIGSGGGVEETNPSLTYDGGLLDRIDYQSGNYKQFTWTSGKLTRVDYVVGALTKRKDFTYNPDGTLDSIANSEF